MKHNYSGLLTNGRCSKTQILYKKRLFQLKILEHLINSRSPISTLKILHTVYYLCLNFFSTSSKSFSKYSRNTLTIFDRVAKSRKYIIDKALTILIFTCSKNLFQRKIEILHHRRCNSSLLDHDVNSEVHSGGFIL